MTTFWKNALANAAITAFIMFLGSASAILAAGDFGDRGTWLVVAATTLGALASALRTTLTTIKGDPASGQFFEDAVIDDGIDGSTDD